MTTRKVKVSTHASGSNTGVNIVEMGLYGTLDFEVRGDAGHCFQAEVFYVQLDTCRTEVIQPMT